jgi:hypothetical protein
LEPSKSAKAIPLQQGLTSDALLSLNSIQATYVADTDGMGGLRLEQNTAGGDSFNSSGPQRLLGMHGCVRRSILKHTIRLLRVYVIGIYSFKN